MKNVINFILAFALGAIFFICLAFIGYGLTCLFEYISNLFVISDAVVYSLICLVIIFMFLYIGFGILDIIRKWF